MHCLSGLHFRSRCRVSKRPEADGFLIDIVSALGDNKKNTFGN
jgi:hypothetical protein